MVTFCLLEDIFIVNLITTINYNNALIKVQIKFITTVSESESSMYKGI